MDTKDRNWLGTEASQEWENHFIRHKSTANVYKIAAVIGETLIKVSREGEEFATDAKTIRRDYEPWDSRSQ